MHRIRIASSGEDFRLALPSLELAIGQRFRLSITATAACDVHLILNESGFDTTVTLGAKSTRDLVLPRDTVMLPRGDRRSRRSLHLVSSAPVTVIATNDAFYLTESFLALPTPSLGFGYLVSTAPNDTTGSLVGDFAVVATEDSTTVRITPSIRTESGNVAGAAFAVTLDAGELYQVEAGPVHGGDLTGSMVTADHPVALVAAHRSARLLTSDATNSLLEEIPRLWIGANASFRSRSSGRTARSSR